LKEKESEDPTSIGADFIFLVPGQNVDGFPPRSILRQTDARTEWRTAWKVLFGHSLVDVVMSDQLWQDW